MHKYFTRVTNPSESTLLLLYTFQKEFNGQIEEYWQKIDDPDIKLSIKPIYSTGFTHVVKLYVERKTSRDFIKYFIHHNIKLISHLNRCLIKEQQ